SHPHFFHHRPQPTRRNGPTRPATPPLASLPGPALRPILRRSRIGFRDRQPQTGIDRSRIESALIRVNLRRMRFLCLLVFLFALTGCGKTVREARLYEPSPHAKLPSTAAPLI